MDKKKIPPKNELQKNEIVELGITGLGSSGEGVGRFEGFTVFVPGALPGEKVQAKLALVKKSYAQGRLQKILQKSPSRVAPRCPVYTQCGGCQLQHLSYEAQLAEKRQQVVDAMERIGHFRGIKVEKTLAAENPFYYRNKMQVPAASSGRNTLEIGCFAQGTHRVVDVEECFIQQQANNMIASVVRRWMKEYKIPAWDEDAGTGIVRHVMGRVGVRTGEVMAVLIAGVSQVPHIKELGKLLAKEIPGFKTLVLNINTRHTNVIMGEHSRIVTGEGFIHDRLGELSFKISPLSFFQVNSLQAERLYGEALKAAGLTGKETVIDVYCGTGTITLFLAKKAKEAFGIEIVASAIADAKNNARNNGIKNAHFILGDAGRELPRLVEAGVKADVIVLDPPRAGCEERVLRTIAGVKPQRVVYVSCNPATLARDAEILCSLGYFIKRVQPVDMFPQTHHVETVALLALI